MTHWKKKIVVSICVLFLSNITKGGVGVACDAPELIEGHQEYNEFICAGILHMQEKKYKEAVDAFESALAVPLFEISNFELFPKLAWAYFRAGNLRKSQESLAKAELALSVFVGLLECIETNDGFYLQRRNGERISGENSNEIAVRMCGAAFDYIYKHRSLERVLQDADLVKNYFDVKQRIVKAQQSPSKNP